MQFSISPYRQGKWGRSLWRLAAGFALLLITSFAFAQSDLPDSVTVAGTIQSVLGCSDDWQSDCEDTMLTYDATDGIWRGSFDLPAGEYEYKAALNGLWTLNYGAGAEVDGAILNWFSKKTERLSFFLIMKPGGSQIM